MKINAVDKVKPAAIKLAIRILGLIVFDALCNTRIFNRHSSSVITCYSTILQSVSVQFKAQPCGILSKHYQFLWDVLSINYTSY